MSKQTATPTETTLSPELIGAITAAAVGAAKATQKPENASLPKTHWWNQFGAQGYPKLRWARAYFCGGELVPRTLTADESGLLNKITTPGTYPVEGRQVEVRITGNGKDQTLDIRVPGVNTIEGRMGMPSLKNLLREIVDAQPVAA